MKSTTTEAFWTCYAGLPAAIKRQAKGAYRLFLRDPHHPSLHFKRIHSTRPIYSVRVSRDYRAIAIQQKGEIIWFWIGSHSNYERLLEKSRRS